MDSEIFMTNDNGYKSYKVVVTKDEINIYKPDEFILIDNNDDKQHNWLIKTIDSYLEIFIGEDPTSAFRCNSILIQCKKNK